MLNRLRSLVIAISAGILLASSVPAAAQKAPPDPKTIPDSITYIWNDVEHDFTAVAEAMPEDKWSFKPTQGEFKKVRTFAEQVKHVACSNEAWAKQISGEKPPPVATSAAQIPLSPKPRSWPISNNHFSHR
ncbi:MAG: DinB family protein [Terriglobales bacterium]